MAKENPDWLTGGTGEGWDAFRDRTPEEIATANEEAMIAEYEEAKLVHDVMRNGRGPELMELLRERTLMIPATRMTGVLARELLEIPVTPEQWLWIRTGMNIVFNYFEAEIVKAERGPPRVVAETGGQDA